MKQLITLEDALYKRQSIRSYDMNGLSQEELKEIEDYVKSIDHLISELKYSAQIVGPNDIKAIAKWRAPHYFLLYSEDSTEGRMNVAYIYEQLVIYLTSLGIGTCWATSISPKEGKEKDGLKWCATIAFGKTEQDILRDSSSIKRKSLSEISDQNDERLEAVRIAPSSMNNQPWYFKHNGETIEVLCKKQGLLKKWMIEQNHIDMGIALGNLKIANKELTYTPFENKEEENGYIVFGEMKL